MEVVNALKETRRQLSVLQAAQAAAVPVGGSASSSTEKAATKLVSTVDANIAKKVGTFNGCDDDWKHWRFIFESTAGLIDVDSVLAMSEATPDEIGLDYELEKDEVKLRMKALCHLLVLTTRGTALTIMQMGPKNNGSVG
jgi:hypothetical protein